MHHVSVGRGREMCHTIHVFFGINSPTGCISFHMKIIFSVFTLDCQKMAIIEQVVHQCH